MLPDAFPGREFMARVSLVNPVVDRTNGTVKVTLEVHDPDRVLRPGNFARVRLRTGSFDHVMVVPRRSNSSFHSRCAGRAPAQQRDLRKPRLFPAVHRFSSRQNLLRGEIARPANQPHSRPAP